jgi:hypothetical protein
VPAGIRIIIGNEKVVAADRNEIVITRQHAIDQTMHFIFCMALSKIKLKPPDLIVVLSAWLVYMPAKRIDIGIAKEIGFRKARTITETAGIYRHKRWRAH